MPRAVRNIAAAENKKVITQPDENFSDDEINRDENDGNDDVINPPIVEQLRIDNQNVEINRFFNELPIRILNSHQFPFFYVEDISKILGIKRIKSSLDNFTEKEIVSHELRRKYNIVTYQKYKNGTRRNDRMVLLTEFGVYRLLMNSRSQLADKFRDFIYDVLYNLRTRGEYKIKGELEQLQITNENLRKDVDRLQSKLADFKNLCDELVLVEYANNPYEILPTNIPAQLLKKSAKARVNGSKNRIDDPVPHAYRIAQELGIEFPAIDVGIEAASEDLRVAHEKNITRAHEFIDAHSAKKSYLVTTSATPEILTEGSVLHRVYVRDRHAALRTVNASLNHCKPDRVSARGHYYTCDKEKIITCMNAICD